MKAPASQHVCTAYGYNMIGPKPAACPFCGAGAAAFLTDAACSARYRVTASAVAPGITRLNSVPPLGIEHAAYRIEADGANVWIDCPSSFNADALAAQVIAFTHKDFLGASNQYRAAFGAEVWIHAADAVHPLARPFPFDRRFDTDFEAHGIAAKHIGGHSPGFTAYRFGDTLFACDLVFDRGSRTRFNPYGQGARGAAEAARRLLAWLGRDELARVCGWNYVSDYAGWRDRVAALVARNGRPLDRGPAGPRAPELRRYICNDCALVYDPVLGMPEDGIPPGTPFAAIPDTWRCPDCRLTKADFVAIDS